MVHEYLMCQVKMLWETLVEVQQVLELFLELSEFLLFLQNSQLRRLKQTVFLHLLLSCLYADQVETKKNK